MHTRVASILASVLSFSLTLGLASCMMLPISSTYYNQYQYTEWPLLNLANGNVASLIRECRELTSDKGLLEQGCDDPLWSLLVRPKAWDIEAEVRQQLGHLPPDGQRLGENIYFFGRVAIGSRGDSGEFIGYFVKHEKIVKNGTIDFVWVRPGPTDASAVEKNIPVMEYDVVKWDRPDDEPSLPLLVVRDGTDAWLFAERGGPCTEDLCYDVAETLGVEPEMLPEELLHPLMLYHASLDGPNKEFERVLPSHLAGYLGIAAGLLPPRKATYVFDFNTVPKSRFGSARREVACEVENTTTEHILFAGITPLGQYEANTGRSRLRRCRAAEATKTQMEGPFLVPEPVGTLPDREHDDPRIDRDGSSYYCQQNKIPGNRKFGEGKNECHFVLHDPKTRRILPRTPYLIWMSVSPASNEILEVKGITDAKGQTAVVCSEKPITISDLRVSRRILSAREFSLPDGLGPEGISRKLLVLAVGAADQDRAGLYRFSTGRGSYSVFRQRKGGREGISLQRFSDLGRVYTVPYRMELCTGAFIEDLSDDMGWTVFYDSKTTEDCPVSYWAP